MEYQNTQQCLYVLLMKLRTGYNLNIVEKHRQSSIRCLSHNIWTTHRSAKLGMRVFTR